MLGVSVIGVDAAVVPDRIWVSSEIMVMRSLPCVAEPSKCLGPPAPAIVLRTSDGDAGSPPTLEVR